MSTRLSLLIVTLHVSVSQPVCRGIIARRERFPSVLRNTSSSIHDPFLETLLFKDEKQEIRDRFKVKTPPFF